MTTVITQSATIIDTVEGLRDGWCVYEHWLFNDGLQSDQIIYIGMCRIGKVFTMPDAYRNSEWRKLVSDNSTLTIRIAATGSYADCAKYRGQLLLAMAHRPQCNALGFDMVGTSSRITCNETGVEYATQSECADALNISQGNLSLHLNGKLKRVGGFTFRRE